MRKKAYPYRTAAAFGSLLVIGWAAGAAHGAEQEWLVLHASGAFADPFALATGPAPFIPTADKPGAKRSAA